MERYYFGKKLDCQDIDGITECDINESVKFQIGKYEITLIHAIPVDDPNEDETQEILADIIKIIKKMEKEKDVEIQFETDVDDKLSGATIVVNDDVSIEYTLNEDPYIAYDYFDDVVGYFNKYTDKIIEKYVKKEYNKLKNPEEFKL